MNILREIRKAKKRSMVARCFLILLFATFLIINTFAWYSIIKKVDNQNLGAVVTPWNVEFYTSDSEEPLDETVTFTVNEMYPGMPEFEDYVFIRNAENRPSTIEFKLKRITLFGELIYSDEVIENFENELEPIVTRTEVEGQTGIYSGTIDLITEGEDYPFHISYSYDKDKISGKYESDILTPDAFATFTMNIEWDYELLVNDLVSSDRDNLDTDFGKRAYEFYSNEEETNAIEIKVEIKAIAS